MKDPPGGYCLLIGPADNGARLSEHGPPLNSNSELIDSRNIMTNTKVQALIQEIEDAIAIRLRDGQ